MALSSPLAPLHCCILPSPRPSKSIASLSPNPNSKTLNPLSLAAAAAVAGAALLLSSLRLPALAVAAPPPPTSAAAAAPVAETLENSGDDERVLEDHLALHPHDADALRSLLDLKIKSQKISDAVGVLDRLIAVQNDEKELPLLKSSLLSYAGDFEGAKRVIEEILEKDPLSVEAYHGLVMAVYRSGDSQELENVLKRVEDAIELCRKAKRMDDVRDFRLLVGQIRVVQGKYEDAIKVYDELTKEDSGDFRPYLCQGIVYTMMRKKDEAEKKFEKYKKLVPKNHRYVDFFDEGMLAMKTLRQKMDESRRATAMES